MAIAASPGGIIATADALLDAIRRAGLLGPVDLERARELVADRRYARQPDRLCARMVRDQLLTEYQARCLLHGMGDRLAIGRSYVILEPLGRGSMGRVYRARHRLLGREVALKVIASGRFSHDEIVARFLREMRLVGRLDHPHVVRALDADRIGNIPYIVLEYVPGKDLGQVLSARGPLPFAAVASMGAQAAAGLAHAHEHGVVHRDVKPSNILLGDDGRVRVLDLGLGVLMEQGADENGDFATAAGVVVGTVEYISPEQAAGEPVDGRADLYSLGCTLYHLLAGAVPFPHGSKVERLARRIQGRPVPLADLRPDVPAGLLEVMDKLLANRPGDRQQDGHELAEALLQFADPVPQAAPVTPFALRSDALQQELEAIDSSPSLTSVVDESLEQAHVPAASIGPGRARPRAAGGLMWTGLRGVAAMALGLVGLGTTPGTAQ